MPFVEYERLTFKNAYIYRECDVPLKDQGLVLLRGLNVDDGGYLGAGKSSIFEVFSQVQLGKGGKSDLRKGNYRTAIVNEYIGSGFEAHLYLRIDGRSYDIVQYQQHATYGNSVRVIDRDTGENVIPKENARAPHKWVRETLLGTDDTTFFNLVYLAQEFNNIMVHGSEADRRTRLTAMFNLDIYNELYKLASRSISTHSIAVHDMERVEVELQEVNQSLKDLPSLESLEAEVQEKEDALTKVQQSVNDKMVEFTELSEKENKLKQRRDYVLEVRKAYSNGKFGEDITSPKDITEEYYSRIKTIYENTYAEFITSKNKFESLKKRRLIENQLANISGRDQDVVQEELSEAKAQIRYLQNTELIQAEERLETMANLQRIAVPKLPLDSLETEYQEYFTRESELKSKISRLSSQLSEAVCPTCKRPFDMGKLEVKRLQTILETARSDLDDVSSYLHKVKDNISAYKKYTDLKRKFDSFSSTRTPEEVQKDINKYIRSEKSLTAELERSRHRLLLESQLSDMPAENEEELQDTVRRLKKFVDTYRAQSTSAAIIVDLIEKIVRLPKGDLEDISTRVLRVKRHLDNSATLLSAASKKVSKLSGIIDDVRRLLYRRIKLEEAIQRREFILKELKCYEALKKAFSPTGLKQDRFHAILTDATERTVPIYANVLWPNRNIRLGLSEDAGSVQFHMERDGTPLATNSSLLSGGERHKAGLAFLFGMRDLKENYTGTASNVLIVDEPFGGLDPQGTESLISLFELLKKRFGSIFVISHRPEVLQHPVWDQTWWAIREDNNATLYTSSPPARYIKLADEIVKQ